jgi:putative peptidoglycan lipid II flippase
VPLVALSLAFPRFFVVTLLHFSDPVKVATAAQLMRWMFNYILLVSLSSISMAILNTHGKFVIPALAPLAFTLATVIPLIFFHGTWGVIAMGVGVCVGGFLQLFFQLPGMRRLGYPLLPSFDFRNPDFTRTAGLWLPYLASASIVAINQFVAQRFASGLEDGSVTAISNAVMFFQIPIGIFTASVATVTFPRMSRQVVTGDTKALRGTVSYGIEALIVLLVPSTILLCLFGREIIAAAVQRGHFTTDNTLMAARTLVGYSVGILSMGVYTLLQRLFNSYKSFSVPLVSAAGIAVVDITLSLILKETPLRVTGLAYANSIAFTLGCVYLLVLARKRLGGIGLRPILFTTGKTALGCAPMTVLLILFNRWQPSLWLNGGRLRSTAIIAAVIVACVSITLLMYILLRIPFLNDLLHKRRTT